jgi:hypothetical protein
MGTNWLRSVMTIRKRYLGVHLGSGAQPEGSRSAARLEKLLKTANISYAIKKCFYFSYTTTPFGLFLIYHNYGI